MRTREAKACWLGCIGPSINMAAAKFQDKDFLSGVRSVLIATGVVPANLELEMTDRTFYGRERCGHRACLLDGLRPCRVNTVVGGLPTRSPLGRLMHHTNYDGFPVA